MSELLEMSKIGLPGYFLDPENVIVYGKKGTPMKFKPSVYGYPIATFTVNGKNDTRKLSRIVAEMCIPNPNNYPMVMHLDDDKLNNFPDNLAWGNASLNGQMCYDRNMCRGNTKTEEEQQVIKEAILAGGTYQEIIQRCKEQKVKLSKGTLTKYKKMLECND